MDTVSILFLVFPFAMILAAFCDLLSMTIPNRINAGLCAAFLVLAPLAGFGWDAMAMHVAAAFLVLLLGIGCFSAGWMGGGDAKLMTAVALWLGPGMDLLQFAMLSAILGGVLTLALLNARAFVAPATGIGFVDRLLQPETGVPYGIALGGAGLLIFPATGFFDAATRALAG
jgi:prepilin peptidase CpaA